MDRTTVVSTTVQIVTTLFLGSLAIFKDWYTSVFARIVIEQEWVDDDGGQALNSRSGDRKN
jgi:hypothetical protein